MTQANDRDSSESLLEPQRSYYESLRCQQGDKSAHLMVSNAVESNSIHFARLLMLETIVNGQLPVTSLPLALSCGFGIELAGNLREHCKVRLVVKLN